MLLALAALTLLSACNKEKNRASYGAFGSQENGKTLILSNGTVCTPVSGGEYISALPTGTGTDRTRMMMWFNVVGDIPAEEWPQTLDIELLSYAQSPTKSYLLSGTAEANDPILFPLFEENESQTTSGQTPNISTSMNYLDMNIYYYPYLKNSTTVVDVDPVLEIDEQIVPGPERDTINMYLRFDSNRGSNDFADAQLIPYPEPISFDLEHAADELGFPTTDAQGNLKTYVIKMAYTSFVNLENPEEDKLVTRYVTVDWTPGNPYGKTREELEVRHELIP